MTDETTAKQSSLEKDETVNASSMQKEPDDEEEEEDLFEAGDDDVVATNNQEPVSSTSVKINQPPASIAPLSSPSLADIPIPHKSPTARQSKPPALTTPPLPTTLNTSTNHTFLDPASFGLPPGVKIPKSVTGALLRQGKLLEMLQTLPTQSINDALTEYDDAVDVKGSGIRNHGAYLYGVVKRYQSVLAKAQQSGHLEILPMGHAITPAVHHRLELLVSTGFCTRDEMDEKVRSKIRMLSEKDALLALEELSSVERTSIRNFGSYFMGILNRYMRGDVSSSSKPPRGREPSYRENNKSSYTRERSRDRVEPRYENNTQYAPSYDDRHRPRPMPQPPQSMYSNSMTYNPPGMNNSNNNMMPPYAGKMNDAYGMNQAAGRNDTYGYNQGPNVYPYGGPPPPPPHIMNPPMQQPMMHAQPQQPMMMHPQPQQQMMNPPAQQMMHSQPQQQMMNPPPHMISSQPTPYGATTSQQNYGNWQQQQSSSVPGLDIFGLADKAASAVQALANQNGMQQPSFSQKTMSNYGGMNPPPYNPGMLQQYPPTDHSGRSGRRTTATLGQLTPSVRYLVQSIQTSGAVEGPLDDGILGMIHDLPENMAVAALQRFVSIDKTTMRNKTAYLAGILRRELETIKKR
ncbi:hypothetical protein FisN_8Hh105 [Fistulifera solaris]|uniref:Heterogeneous nuclear ribonucleoprotein Q acidic domain-containing protein n=1 Tax=Fistulifera solaris TaxID=1519565 RepID=A0A1Z5JYB0_FISSO|nr:hypothetical protein FisN_8Hh105 [Fistulifera solaris]|eukprot:GAX18889.1 hypothetical protein FisN_8Hh105 [Fistulifera solaris]